MPQPAWSLEAEFGALTGTSDFRLALYSLGLLPAADSVFEWKVVADWHRSGAETYLFVFDVTSASDWKKLVAVKACTPTPASEVLEQVLQQWLERRSIISSQGIATPRLYCHGAGLIVEQFVEFSLADAFQFLDRHKVLSQICRIAAVLDHSGFSPVAPFADLRTDRFDIYMIDFGSDLGPPNATTEGRVALTDLVGFINRNGLGREAEVHSSYLSHLQELTRH